MKTKYKYLSLLTVGLAACGSHKQQSIGPDVDSVGYEVTKQTEGNWRDMEQEAFGDSLDDTPEKAELRRQYRNKHHIK